MTFKHVISKKRKKSRFLKCEENVKYVFSNTGKENIFIGTQNNVHPLLKSIHVE